MSEPAIDTKPRKLPRQSRAKATVAAIVEATTQLLQREGYARITTAHVAERAGVSVGTLYQYFPNKAALASAVIDRCCEDFLAKFEATLGRHAQDRLGPCLDVIVEETLLSHHLAPDLHRIVQELAPRIGVAERIGMVSLAMAGLIETLLRQHADEIAPDVDLATAAILIESMLETIAHRVQLAASGRLPDDVLAREARRMILRYLDVDTSGARIGG